MPVTCGNLPFPQCNIFHSVSSQRWLPGIPSVCVPSGDDNITVSYCPVKFSLFLLLWTVSGDLVVARHLFSLLWCDWALRITACVWVPSIGIKCGLWWMRKRILQHIMVIRYGRLSAFPSSCAWHISCGYSVCNCHCIYVIKCIILCLCDMIALETSQRCGVKMQPNRLKEKTRKSQEWGVFYYSSWSSCEKN